MTTYISDIVLTVKGQRRVIHLGPLTVLCGDNGSGKSALTQSVELAVSGGASDIAGRGVVRDARLLDLFPTDDATVQARWSDGALSEWSWRGKSVQSGRKALLVTTDTVDALRGGDARLLATFAQWSGASVPDVPSALLSAAKSDLKSRQALLDEMVKSGPVEVPSRYCPTCHAEVTEETARAVRSARDAEYERQLGVLARQVEALKSDVARLGAEVKQAEEALSAAGRSALGRFCLRASELLPAGWQATVTTVGPVRVLLDRGNGAVAAPSGGEWALLCAALAVAVAEAQSDPAVVIVEDRGLSARTLAALLPRLARARCQVILPTVTPVSPVEGWTVLPLDSAS